MKKILLYPTNIQTIIWLDYNDILKHLKFKDIKNLFKKINLLM